MYHFFICLSVSEVWNMGYSAPWTHGKQNNPEGQPFNFQNIFYFKCLYSMLQKAYSNIVAGQEFHS